MHQRPHREHKPSVLAGSSAEALGQTQAHEIERGPGFVQRGRLGESIEEHLVGVGMLKSKLEVAFAGLSDGPGAAEGGEEIDAGLDADRAENIVAVVVALIESRSGGAGRAGDAAHGQRLFAAPRPKPAGGVEDALFELRISLPGQRPASISRQSQSTDNHEVSLRPWVSFARLRN